MKCSKLLLVVLIGMFFYLLPCLVSFKFQQKIRSSSVFHVDPVFSDARRGYAATKSPQMHLQSSNLVIGKKLGRKLGSYEKLLSRTLSDGTVALSHGCAAIVEGELSRELLIPALKFVMEKYPMLRVRIDSDSWSEVNLSLDNALKNILKVSQDQKSDFDTCWQESLQNSLNNPSFPIEGPLWNVQFISSQKDTRRHALIFTINHGIDDQQSLHLVINDIISVLNGNLSVKADRSTLPPSIENVFVKSDIPTIDMLKWAIYQLSNSLQNPIMLPKKVREKVLIDLEYQQNIVNPSNRRTSCTTFSINENELSRLLLASKAHQCTVTQTLSALILCLTSAMTQQDSLSNQKLRFLLSVSLRNFQPTDSTKSWASDDVVAASSAIDYNVDVVAEGIREVISIRKDAANDLTNFWSLAASCKEKSDWVLNQMKFVPQSAQLFDFGMKFVDIFQAVDIESRNPKTLGRGYSCSVSNAGIMKTAHGPGSKVFLSEIYYGTSQSISGVLVQLSCTTLHGKLFGNLQFPTPIISEDEIQSFRSKLVDFLRMI
jgi:hypothetical protein